MHPEQLDALVDAARAGGGWAFERLWRELAPSVAGYLRGRGVPEADDVTSEVFLAAFQRIGSFEGDGSRFRSWLFTIAHHRGVDALRRASRAPDVQPYHPDDDPRRADSAEAQAQPSLEEADIRALLTTLSPDQADVMLLRVLGGLTVAEVAALTGRTEGAVKQLQRRAVAQLERRITDQQARPTEPVPLSTPPTIAPSR
jgi:RNA polymerase sigma-70 factor (ECF subfamily)